MRPDAENQEELKLDSSDCDIFQNVNGFLYAHLWLFVKKKFFLEKRLF
jgi:hypothetical protein